MAATLILFLWGYHIYRHIAIKKPVQLAAF